MKKFTTKQLAIAFVAIAFVFIFGFTAYRGITGQFQSQPTISTVSYTHLTLPTTSRV